MIRTILAILAVALLAAVASADSYTTTSALDGKTAASSTDNAVARYDSTSGDLQDSAAILDDSDNLDTPGAVTGLARISSYTTSQSLSAQDMRGSVVTNDGAAGAITLTLPEASAGACVTVQLVEAFDVDVDPTGASGCTPLGAACDQIIGDASSGGEYLSSDATVGSSLSLCGLNGNEWMVVGKSGTWTEETP